jgi:hypothetical protein
VRKSREWNEWGNFINSSKQCPFQLFALLGQALSKSYYTYTTTVTVVLWENEGDWFQVQGDLWPGSSGGQVRKCGPQGGIRARGEDFSFALHVELGAGGVPSFYLNDKGQVPL